MEIYAPSLCVVVNFALNSANPLLFSFCCCRFNYRSTHHLTTNGFYEFLNWFDERAWYPLGRIVGGTVSLSSNQFVQAPCFTRLLIVNQFRAIEYTFTHKKPSCETA